MGLLRKSRLEKVSPMKVGDDDRVSIFEESPFRWRGYESPEYIDNMLDKSI